MNKTVYLAGSISGLTYSQATEWRERIKEELAPYGIKCLSPLRAEVYLRNHKGLLNDCQTIEELEDAKCPVLAMSTPRGVFERDKFDCTRCSVLLVNLLGAEKVSIGTAVEIGLAHANHVPIVLIMEESDNVHDHIFITEPAAFRTTNLEQAAEIIKAIIGDY